MEENNMNNDQVQSIDKPRKNRPKKLGQYTCKYCGEKGHNSRKCPKRLADEKACKTV